MSDSLRRHGLQPTRLHCPWNFHGKNTGMGCHFLLQGIFPTQESNPGLPHCRQTLYHLSHQGTNLGTNFIQRILLSFSSKRYHFKYVRSSNMPLCLEVGPSSTVALRFPFTFREMKVGRLFPIKYLWFWRMRGAIGRTMGKKGKTGCLLWLQRDFWGSQ